MCAEDSLTMTLPREDIVTKVKKSTGKQIELSRVRVDSTTGRKQRNGKKFPSKTNTSSRNKNLILRSHFFFRLHWVNLGGWNNLPVLDEDSRGGSTIAHIQMLEENSWWVIKMYLSVRIKSDVIINKSEKKFLCIFEYQAWHKRTRNSNKKRKK